MKKSIAALAACAAFSAAVSAEVINGPLVTKWETDNDTTIIKHKKGWAPVLKLKGDRGVGLYIQQGNKQARGIVMESGGTSNQAKLTMGPSYVAAGIAGNPGFTKETPAAVFKLEGKKLDNGTNGHAVALDVKRQAIYWLDENGTIIAELIPTPVPAP
ncbi:hypothetical protein [Ferrimonas marina]|uniref:Uncharacterized protein n=1 Tax=Ferrimonas marina TaxID=299255 RepID=A0A1M5YDN8_9GAMM|nr:hypothetical protein [Ferrimonas marina]SHI10096.1 hypothetical protein SAMN02745129_4119 [Ferrimonas marina]